MNTNIIITILVLILFFCPCGVDAQTNVGGHLKFNCFDYSHGTHSGINGSLYSGMSLYEAIFYLSAEISDLMTVDIQPYVDTRTGATPQLDATTAASVAGSKKEKWHKSIDPDKVYPEFRGFRKAVISMILPADYELSVGIVKPRFTWDYGAELFWEEEFHGGKFTNDLFLGSMHDAGFELYKPFYLGDVSIPAYCYLLNGGNENSDNNGSPVGMIRLEPEYGPFRLGLSALYGIYDNEDQYTLQRYAVGFQYSDGNLDIRSEAGLGSWENGLGTHRNAEALGYYAKVLYRVHPRLRCMFHYDFVDHNFNSLTRMVPGSGLKYTTYTPGVQLFITDTSILQVQYDIGDWSINDNSDYIDFGRLTVGFRTTF